MPAESPPVRHLFDLGDLSPTGSEVVVTAGDDERRHLADWAGVAAVTSFEARVTVRRLSQNQFAYDADLVADIVQTCVVTLEPLAARIARHITRELHLQPRPPRSGGALTLAAGDDGAPETIDSLDYDLAAPLLEEFVLAVDPYPRKAGAQFEQPLAAGGEAESPFAALKSLKNPG